MNDQTPPIVAPNDDAGALAKPAVDPVVALDELIAKAKAKRASISEGGKTQTGSEDPAGPTEPAVTAEPTGPTPEELQAQKLAELAVKEQEAELENQRLLEQQQQKMQELEETPQYQARKTQDEETAKQQSEQQAAQQGHVINQVSDTKI